MSATFGFGISDLLSCVSILEGALVEQVLPSGGNSRFMKANKEQKPLPRKCQPGSVPTGTLQIRPKRASFQIYRCKEPGCTDGTFDSDVGLKMHAMAFNSCTARLNSIGQQLVTGACSEASIALFKCDRDCGHHKGIDPDEFPLLWNPRRCRQIRKAKRSWASMIMDDWTSKSCTNCGKMFCSKAQFEYHLLKRKRKPFICISLNELAWRSRQVQEKRAASLKAHQEKMYRERSRVTPITPLNIGDSEYRDFENLNFSKRVLPLLIGQNNLDTCADTGSAFNIISRDTAEKLDLEMHTDPDDLKVFELADGRCVHSIGKVWEYCSFPDDPGIRTRCAFYVWDKCSTSVIMGRSFLEKTKVMETPSRFSQRLNPMIGKANLPTVRLIGASHSRLPCYIDGKLVSANPDSGSDLDLMSAQFARVSGFEIKRHKAGRSRMRLADGTIAESIGYVDKEISVGKGTYLTRFQVLPGLRSDILLGDRTLVEADVFNTKLVMLTEVQCHSSPCIPDCAPIIHLSSAERGVFDSKRRLKRLKRFFRKQEDDPLSPTTLADDQRARNAREVHRRLQEQERICTLPEDDRLIAEDLEKTRQENYCRLKLPP